MIYINPILIRSRRGIGLAFVLLFSFVASNQITAATAMVNNVGDASAANPALSPDSTLGVGIVTLRSAIQYLNTQAQPSNTISFNISGTGPFTIQPATDLDQISVPVTIDGYTQLGSSVNTLGQGDNAMLMIVLNGSNYTVGDGVSTGNGLHFVAGSDGSIVRGLVINEWLDNGILIDGTNGTINGIKIIGNFIGTNATGTAVDSNRTGVGISGVPNTITGTIIGTPLFADRNIIAGSFGYMVLDNYTVRGACICSSSGTSTLIQNNYIGTDINGTTALNGSDCGVMFLSETSSLIGGTATNQRNIISGHSIYGVNLTGILFGTFNVAPGNILCVVQGNYIGTDITGTIALGNSNAGLALDSYSLNNTILNNLISGNGTNLIPGSGVGIRLGQFDMPGSFDNSVQGNLIGTDVTGTKALANTGFGIIVNDSQNTIGGSSALQRNIISGNRGGGILIYGANSDIVNGNFIGTDISGTKKIPNGGNGVQLGTNGTVSCGATGNTVGV